jgi:N-acetylglucosamine malate deacetylase 2
MKKIFINIRLAALLILLSFSFVETAYPQSQPDIKALIVTAHPDDETTFAATVYKITHDLKGKVDIVLITNGEGGYKYSTLAENFYGLELTDEKVGREYLPSIRKQEMMNGGKIIGIRNYYFLEQKDLKYTQDVQEVFQGLWDIDLVKKRLNEIVSQGGYDLIFTLLPTSDTHGHHKAATILAIETVKNLQTQKKPVVLGSRLSRKDATEKFSFAELDGFPVTKINKNAPIFTFDRTQKFGYKDNLNYKIIANWLIAEHKSQGTTQMAMSLGDLEQFWFFEINNESNIEPTANLFKKLSIITFKSKEY